MTLRVGVFVLALALPVALASPARADPAALAKEVVVVVVDPRAIEIQATKLRLAIGEELGATAVAPDDALAPNARGTIDVSIDRAAHALVVSYREGPTPITRTIDLPGDAASIARAAVLLAGNLARDEASELAAALRKEKGAAPEAASNEPETTPTEAVDEEVSKLDRLGAAIAAHARYGHGVRRTIAWTIAGLGLATEGVGLAVSLSGHSDAGLVLVEEGVILGLAGLLLVPGDFDKLAQYYAYARSLGLPPELARQDVEQAWLRVARAEHWNRKFVGWAEIIIGAIGGSLSAVVLVPIAAHPTEPERSFGAAFSGLLAIDLAGLAVGVSLVVSDGPIESALHAYEGSAGHTIRPSGLSDVAPHLSLGQGGGVLGIGGRF